MNSQRMSLARLALAAASLAAIASASHAQPALPNDFESASSLMDPMFSFFGGVQGFGTESSTTAVFSGQSMRVWGNFRPDPIFRSAGVGVGWLSLPTPALNVPADAAFFSITVKAPTTTGQFSLKANFIEDDDADGILDEVDADDQWDIPTQLIPQNATTIFNIPLTSLLDANPLVGNDTLNITTTSRIAFTLTFETRTTNPGGIVQTPTEFFVDHAGFFSTAQTIPTTCLADYNHAAGVTLQDIFDFLTDWFNSDPRADINTSGGVSLQDIFDFVTAWFAGC